MGNQTQLFHDRRVSKNECLALITEPLARGFGYRHLWIGYTGSGKTFAAVETVAASEGAHDYVIVTDQKSRTSPYGTLGYSEIPSIEALLAVPEDKRGKKQAIIRGVRATGKIEDAVDFDVLASEIWKQALERNGVLFAIDELSDACQGERTWVKGADPKRAYMRLLYAQGRENKVSICACTQHVQEIPRSAISNSDTLGIFVQDRKELPYYQASNFLDSRELDIVANLNPYEFLLVKRGMESVICRF